MTTRVRSFEEEERIDDRVTADAAEIPTVQAKPRARTKMAVRTVARRLPQIIGALQAIRVWRRRATLL
jgi:hypothetical protein